MSLHAVEQSTLNLKSVSGVFPLALNNFYYKSLLMSVFWVKNAFFSTSHQLPVSRFTLCAKHIILLLQL